MMSNASEFVSGTTSEIGYDDTTIMKSTYKDTVALRQGAQWSRCVTRRGGLVEREWEEEAPVEEETKQIKERPEERVASWKRGI